jgi:hypothetical protein
VKLPNSAKVKVKRALAKDPDATTAQVKKKLSKDDDLSDATINNIRSDFRQTLAILQEIGELKTLKITG